MMNEKFQTEDQKPKTKDLIWLISCVLVTAVASFVRFFWLDLKPLHHDEGVNGYFLTTLFRNGEYKYDPANYHGPDLYYIALFFAKTFGLNTWSIRSSVAVFGVLTVVLAFFLKKYIGKIGSLCAALFLALSPGMVYISRYFIHEILFVFFSFGIALSILFFIEKRKAGILAIVWTSLLLLVCFLPSALNLANVIGGENETAVWSLRIAFFLVEAGLVFFVIKMLLAWNEGQPVYLILASASAVLLFATKETAFITIGTMAIACVCVWLWRKINSVEDFAKNKLWIFMTFNVLVLIGAAVQYKRLKEGYKVLAENFSSSNDANQNYLFYTIIALVIISAVTWLTFLFVNRGQSETEISEDAQLTWTNFREKLTASNNWEIILVKSAIGAAAIFLTWLFVRYAIDLLIAWKANKTLSSALDKIILTKVDFWILTVAVFLLAVAVVVWLVRKPPKFSTDLVLLMLTMTVVFLYVGALFFSSFFTYPEGLKGAFEAYAIWTKTGSTDHTQNGNWAYVRWGMIIESPILILSALGLLISLYKTRHRLAMFAGIWAFGLFAAYTLIPYKTPWLALSFLLPMCIIAGYAVNELITSKNAGAKILGGILAVTATCILAFQTYDLNFVRYDNDALPYIYAHTKRGFLDLIKQIEHYADKSGQGKQVKIEIVSPDYWPMPWYMNDYPNAIFEGKPVDATTAEMIVAKKDEQDAEVITRYAAHYKYVGEYPLRPGVDLILLVRNDLADLPAQDIYSVMGEPLTITPDEPPVVQKDYPVEDTEKKKPKK
ncbi:MAG: glycosyltransferase family 39 protein [Actinomycetota bacterium]